MIYFLLAGAAIFVRFQLAGFKKNAPKMYIALYVVNVSVSLAHVFAVVSALNGDNRISLRYTNSASQIAVGVVFILCNLTYFKKRAHLFKN